MIMQQQQKAHVISVQEYRSATIIEILNLPYLQ